MGAPVAVVPPGIEAERKKALQFFLTIGDLGGIEHALRARDGLGVIVEHDLDAVLVREVKEALHIGEEFGVDVVPPPVGAVPPVGVDDHIVERDAVLFVS